MSEVTLTPPANSANIEKILQSILGRKRNVKKISSLTPQRDQKTFLCEFENGEKLVIKYSTRDEWNNQKVASEVGIPAPGIIGDFFEIFKWDKKQKKKISQGGWYGQDYIEFMQGKVSKTLSDFLQDQPASADLALGSAVALLSSIHNSLKSFEKKRKSLLPIFSKKVLYEQLQDRTYKRLFPLFKLLETQQEYKKTVKHWHGAVKAFSSKRSIHSLGAEENPTVLVRWDYKPDNLLVRKTNRGISLISIDWGVLWVGSPWIDLGFLLADFDEKKRERYLKVFLALQKDRSTEWKNVNLEVVKNKMEIAFPLIQLIHASTNAKFILDKKDIPYTYERLSYHLNKLVEEVT